MTSQDLSQIISRIEKLEKAVFGRHGEGGGKIKKRKGMLSIDFSLNLRAFAKRYAASKSGPKKFVLLVAYFSKGQVGSNVKVHDIKKEWDKMRGKNMLGKFNRFYSNQAKTQGWLDSKEYSTYCLTKEWKEVL